MAITWQQAMEQAVSGKSIRDTTKDGYRGGFRRYMQFLGYKTTDEFSTDPQTCYNNLQKRLKYCSEKTKMREVSIEHIFFDAKRLYMKNLVNLTDAQYDNLYDTFVGEDLKENRGWHDDEALKMTTLGWAGIRGLAILYLAASSGLRKTAMAHLTFGHLKQVVIDGKAYPNYWVGPVWDKKRYRVACSSYEFFNQINAYREYREKIVGEVIYDIPIREDKGEKVNFKKQSPLFRNDIGLRGLAKDDPRRTTPEGITPQMIGKELGRIAELSGVRILRQNQEDRINTQYEAAAVHGWRARFETACMNYIGEDELKMDVTMNAKILKLLMGHEVDIEKYYYEIDHEPSRKRIFGEFLKVQPNLIINKDKTAIKNLTKENIQLKTQIVEDRAEFKNWAADFKKRQEKFMDKAADKLGIDLGED